MWPTRSGTPTPKRLNHPIPGARRLDGRSDPLVWDGCPAPASSPRHPRRPLCSSANLPPTCRRAKGDDRRGPAAPRVVFRWRQRFGGRPVALTRGNPDVGSSMSEAVDRLRRALAMGEDETTEFKTHFHEAAGTIRVSESHQRGYSKPYARREEGEPRRRSGSPKTGSPNSWL
jgi:hypothetical protein